VTAAKAEAKARSRCGAVRAARRRSRPPPGSMATAGWSAGTSGGRRL